MFHATLDLNLGRHRSSIRNSRGRSIIELLHNFNEVFRATLTLQFSKQGMVLPNRMPSLGPGTPQRCSSLFPERHESTREAELRVQHNLPLRETPSAADLAPPPPSTAEPGSACRGGSNGNR